MTTALSESLESMQGTVNCVLAVIGDNPLKFVAKEKSDDVNLQSSLLDSLNEKGPSFNNQRMMPADVFVAKRGDWSAINNDGEKWKEERMTRQQCDRAVLEARNRDRNLDSHNLTLFTCFKASSNYL
jgi:hypothetical protein